MFRSFVFGAAIGAAVLGVPPAQALEPSEIFGTWQDAAMRVEITADHISMGFDAPNYDQGADSAPVTFQDYRGGLLLKAPDGSGILVTLLPDGHLSLVFPGAAAATLTRITTSH